VDSIDQEIREYRKPGDVKPGDRIHLWGYWYPVTAVIPGEKSVAIVTKIRRWRDDDGTPYAEEKIHELPVDDEVLTEPGGAT